MYYHNLKMRRIIPKTKLQIMTKQILFVNIFYLVTIVPLPQEDHNQQQVCLPEVVPIQQEGYKEGILKTVSPVEVHAEMLLHLCMGTKPEY